MRDVQIKMANAPALFVRWLVIGSRARRNILANLIFSQCTHEFLGKCVQVTVADAGEGPGGLSTPYLMVWMIAPLPPPPSEGLDPPLTQAP